MLLLELVHPLPSHHQETDNTNKIGDGHEDPTEVVALLNSSDPIPPGDSNSSLKISTPYPFLNPYSGWILEFFTKKKTAPGL